MCVWRSASPQELIASIKASGRHDKREHSFIIYPAAKEVVQRLHRFVAEILEIQYGKTVPVPNPIVRWSTVLRRVMVISPIEP